MGLARQSISIDVLYNREFKSDDEVNIFAEDKDVDVTMTIIKVSVVGRVDSLLNNVCVSVCLCILPQGKKK